MLKSRKSKVSVLIVIAAIAGSGIDASAAVVVFENPGGPNYFDWANGSVYDGEWTYLDVTLPPEQQSDQIEQLWSFEQAQYDHGWGYIWSHSGEFLYDSSLLWNAVVSVNVGDSVSNKTVGGIAWKYGWGEIYNPFVAASEIPMDEETFLGIRFELVENSGEFHYGWIGVVRSAQASLDAFAWGYETAPGVPIVAGAGLDEPTCEADMTDGGATNEPDGTVNVFDLLELLSNWNTNGPGAGIADPTDNVDIFDLLALLQAWGPCQ